MTRPDTAPVSDTIPAATVVIFRERENGPPEVLMMERSSGMAFAAGAVVFPGGRVDPVDYMIAADPKLVRFQSPLEPADAAARVAAIRETLEESGLAIGFVATPDSAITAAIRKALDKGEDFGAVLAAGNMQLDLDALIPFARWCPNFKEARVFDTRFYITRIETFAETASVDQTENVDLFWASAAEVLAKAERGEAQIIFPTRRNLERLALFANFAAARTQAEAIPVRLIQPWIEERGGERMLCINPDAGYPVNSEPLSSVRRG